MDRTADKGASLRTKLLRSKVEAESFAAFGSVIHAGAKTCGKDAKAPLVAQSEDTPPSLADQTRTANLQEACDGTSSSARASWNGAGLATRISAWCTPAQTVRISYAVCTWSNDELRGIGKLQDNRAVRPEVAERDRQLHWRQRGARSERERKKDPSRGGVLMCHLSEFEILVSSTAVSNRLHVGGAR